MLNTFDEIVWLSVDEEPEVSDDPSRIEIVSQQREVNGNTFFDHCIRIVAPDGMVNEFWMTKDGAEEKVVAFLEMLQEGEI